MSDTTTTTTGQIVWFELPAADTERAKSFYGDLLGWRFEAFGGTDYHVAGAAGGAISGMPGPKGLVAYFGVEDVDAAMAQVRELGGEAGDKQEIPGTGFYAVCTDTEGNTFGLYQDASA